MLRDLLAQAGAELPGETPILDAQVLLAHIIGRNRAWVLAHPETVLNPVQAVAFAAGVGRLREGTPLPYVLGHWEFFGLDFEVTPDVLIPRPETELLVETALEWIRNHPPRWRPAGLAHTILDVGTGSGCIPVALATHLPAARITATDISAAAIAVARRNAQRNGVADRIEFVECDLLPLDVMDASWADLDLVTANLPYIPSAELKKLAVFRSEPTLALDGGPDGLELIRRLLAGLADRTTNGGLILLEIEAGQGRAARELSETVFPVAEIEIKKDLAGYDRLVIIET